ncbi:g3012 [Coccomyxa elongata]
MQNSSTFLAERAKEQFRDCSRVLIFDESLAILYSSFEVPQSELSPLTKVFGDRDAAIRSGLAIDGKRYEVHRHHPPLVYGRSMTEEPEVSEGAAICKSEEGPTGCPTYTVITYKMPHVSARMVQLLRDFCSTDLKQ